MPDDGKFNAKNETAADFMQKQVELAKTNLQCAIHQLGHDAMKVANPVPWFRRYPLQCAITTAALVGAGGLLVVHAFRRREDTKQHPSGPPVNVYVKKPKSKTNPWVQIGATLVSLLSAKLSEGVKTAISDSFAEGGKAASRPKTKIVPNPNLRGVDI